MANDPWTGARLGSDQDSPTGGSYLAEVVNELGKWTTPGFASTAARDAAFNAWVAAGNTPSDSMACFVGRSLYIRQGSTWWTSTPQVFANLAARNAAFPSPRAGDQCMCLGTLMTHDGAAWRFILSGKATVVTDSNGFVTIPHGGGQAPTSWLIGPAYQPTSSLDVAIQVLSSNNPGDPVVLGARIIQEQTNSYMPVGNQVNLNWWAQF